jgi:hypothetical protein
VRDAVGVIESVGVMVTVGVGVIVGVGDRVKVLVGDRVMVGDSVKVGLGVRQLETVTSSIYQPRALLGELSVVTMNRSWMGARVTAAMETCSRTQPPDEVEEVDQRVLQALEPVGVYWTVRVSPPSVCHQA